MDCYQLRFVGRFVFAYTGGTFPRVKTVAAIATDMTHNPDLAIGRHRLLMAAPRCHVHSLGTLPADLSLFETSSRNVDDEDQLLVWDLGGYDVRPVPADAGGSITLNDWDRLPNIGKCGASEFDETLLEQPPGRSIVASRFVFGHGDLTPVELDPEKRVSLEPLGQDGPLTKPTLRLPDVVKLKLSIDGPLRLELTRFADQRRASIVLTPAGAEELDPLVITISNLCPRGGSSFDREFAAYYDVLKKPPTPRKRLIPYTAEVHEGRHADCTGLATLSY